MSDPSLLHGGLGDWATRTPSALAVISEERTATYQQLARASDRLAALLASSGLRPGDRVGLLLEKSVDAVISMFGVLKAGGVYVPIDEQSPPVRQLAVLQDCAVRGVVTTRNAVTRLVDTDPSYPPTLGFVIAREQLGLECKCVQWDSTEAAGGEPQLPVVDPEQAAYILYTSGSTGTPKGVAVSHRGARSFVDWAVRTFQIGPADRLANHAQLSFDLSVLDIFAAISSGAQVHLLSPQLMLRPKQATRTLAEQQITLSYSVPSTLTLLEREGGLADVRLPSLKQVLFAGEVFSIPHLRRVMQALPGARFFNLFGPTETNVCTWHALEAIPAADAQAIPIGVPCEHLRVQILDAEGHPVEAGEAGELCVAGSSVMRCYWGREDLSRAAFWDPDPARGDQPLYRTGDRVRRDDEGLLWFLGRRDRQIKRRGYRIELGELEAALAQLAGARESAVVATSDEHGGCRLHAVIVPEPDAELSVLTVKLHCGRLLPAYMVPDVIDFRSSLPRTPTGKIDLASLA